MLSQMSMYVVLPKDEGATALKSFRDGLTTEMIDYLINNLKNQTCIIGLPRMKLSSSLELNDALQSMGLRSLFNPVTADFSLLSGFGSQPVVTSRPPTVRPISTIPSSLPSPSARVLPQAASQVQRVNTADNNDVLIFSRGSDHGNITQTSVNGARSNHFRYEDKRRGITIEQWGTGFQLSKIRRNPKRRAVADDGPLETSHDYNTKYLSSENKYSLQNSVERLASREKRQIRSMDENFLSYMQNQNFTSYGLDALRNSANLVNPGLFANRVIHKVEMEVTEKGTEAAAATAVLLHRDGNQKRFIANRPFLFFIRHDPTKLVLFWGTINAPTPNYTVR